MKRKRADTAPKRPTKRATTFKAKNKSAFALGGTVGTEKKYVDTASTANALNTTGAVQCINLSAVGDDNTNRDGRQTKNVTIAIRGIVAPEGNTTANQLVRVMLVWDKQPNGALATIANILASASSVAFNNLDNKQRFKILRDYQFAVGSKNNTATQALACSPNVHSINDFVRLPPDCMSAWSNTTGVIASLASGALLLVQIGNVASGSGGTFDGNVRVRWIG